MITQLQAWQVDGYGMALILVMLGFVLVFLPSLAFLAIVNKAIGLPPIFPLGIAGAIAISFVVEYTPLRFAAIFLLHGFINVIAALVVLLVGCAVAWYLLRRLVGTSSSGRRRY